jgi:fructose-1,6-bisphosphatase/inositol monophosphatase family enzyme
MAPAMRVDLDRLGRLLQKVAEAELLPRFRALGPNDVMEKRGVDGRTEIVTVADGAAERALTAELRALLPGSVVVGEESASADPSLLGALDGDAPVWVVDPLDGTNNFARGSRDFGVIVALVKADTVVAGAIHLPFAERTLLAERGAGATHNGEPIRRPASEPPFSGTLYRGYAPKALVSCMERIEAERRFEPKPAGCAASEYANVALGNKDFAEYYRLLPWDHAAGALIVQECGGVARLFDGTDYRPSAREGLLIAAGSETVWRSVRDAFAEAGAAGAIVR